MSDNRRGFWDFAQAHPWLTYWTIGSLIALIPNTIRAIKGTPAEPTVGKSVAKGAAKAIIDIANEKAGGRVVNIRDEKEDDEDGE